MARFSDWIIWSTLSLLFFQSLSLSISPDIIVKAYILIRLMRAQPPAGALTSCQLLESIMISFVILF